MKRVLLATLMLASCGPDVQREDPHAGHEAMGEAADEHAAHRAPAIEVEPEAVDRLGIRTEPAREGAATVPRRAPAIIGYDPLETTRLAAQAGGQVRSLALPRPGEAVRRGQRVARLYEPQVIAAFEELFVARDLGEPWRSAARSRLRNFGVVDAEIEAALTSGQVPQTYGVYAPRAGVVVDRGVSEGAWIGPGGLLGSIASTEEIVADVVVVGQAPEVGERVTLRDTTTGERWPARVASRLPTADAAGTTIRLVPEGSPPVGRPLVAEWVDAAADGVWVPRGAVVDTGERRVVFVAGGEGRFEPRQVRLGTRTADEIQVLEGLMPGEPVVVSGTFLLDSETQIGSMGHAGHGS